MLFQRLQHWYNNHSGARRKVGQGVQALGASASASASAEASTKGSAKKKGLSLGKQERMKPNYIAYQKLYFDTKLRGPIMDEWETYRKTLPHPESEHHKYLQAFRNRRCKELLEKETTEIKEEVERVRRMGKGQLAVLKELKEEAESSVTEGASPEEVEAQKRELEDLSRKQAMQR